MGAAPVFPGVRPAATCLQAHPVHLRDTMRTLIVLGIGSLCFGWALAAGELPPPEATEQWTPLPPVIAAPAGGVPSDAVVLFDGKDASKWEASDWKLADSCLVSGDKILKSKESCSPRAISS